MKQVEWNREKVGYLMELPLFELMHKSYAIHKQHFDPTDMELCTLSSIKTGACPEDCAYCPQSGHYNTGLKKEKLLDVDIVVALAKAAKASGAKRLCMGAAWRNPPKKDFLKVIEMVKAVKAEGLEACVTLGAMDKEQLVQLKEAGLDYYNHNLDSSPEFYKKIITTHTYESRLDTIRNVVDANINVCCGGILGMGESTEDRIQLLLELSKLPTPPKSIPINKLIAIKGTPLGETEPMDSFDFIRAIAVTRCMFPASRIRLSAGRENMSDELQAWCFMAGANSLFFGEKLLTAANPSQDSDFKLLKKLGLTTPKVSDSVPSEANT